MDRGIFALGSLNVSEYLKLFGPQIDLEKARHNMQLCDFSF